MSIEAKAIIFDVDGVLVDSCGFHYRMLQEFLGIPISFEAFLAIHDGNFYKNAGELDWLKDVDWRGYRDFIYEPQSSWVMDRVIRMVLFHLNRTYPLFIVSSTGTVNINQFLANNGVRHLFLEVLGGDRIPSKREKLRRICKVYGFPASRCIYVTDTLGDLREANEVGMPSVAVTFGYHDRARLEQGNPFRIVSHFIGLFLAVMEFEKSLAR
jgi:phosphoglycolate phosphatase-like HAD superfamily hydrolase